MVLISSVCLSLFFWLYFHEKIGSPLTKTLKEEIHTLRSQFIKIKTELDKAESEIDHLYENDELIYRTILESDPLKPPKSREKKTYIEKIQIVGNKSLADEAFEKVAILKKKINFQKKSFKDIFNLAKKRKGYLLSIPAIQPISNRTFKRISGGFGMRLHPIHRVYKMHKGIDYVAPKGTPIYATGSGTILRAKYVSGYGNLVEVDHGRGTITRYGHMHSFNSNITSGVKVVRGQCIGFVGSTGTADGPHVHYEIVRNRKQIDPKDFFFGEVNASQYDEIVEIASRKTRANL